jgi:hypothetical protein
MTRGVSKEQELRAHLISVHGIDWENISLMAGDYEGMRALHDSDHEHLTQIDIVPDHPQDSMATGKVMSLEKANAKTKAEKRRLAQ